MISISIVEDHPTFRQALTSFLKSHDQFTMKGVYANAGLALKGLVKDAPDIAIVDIQMHGMSGIELISRLKGSIPSTQFLVCTSYFDDENVFRALQAGASGYLLKDTDSEIILKSIIELYNGGAPMSPYIARKVISQMQRSATGNRDYGLTSREEQVLTQLSKGYLYKEIAENMFISTLTVKNHLKNIYRKLHVQNKVEALNKYNRVI